jgi:hypothetical protein
MMREADIEKKVILYAKEKGFLVYKFKSPNNKGVPDRLIINPMGLVFFIEFKKKGKKLTILQDYVLKCLSDRSVKTYVVDDVESGKSIIDKNEKLTSLST